MVKGRPKQEDRIHELELQVQSLLTIVHGLILRVTQLEENVRAAMDSQRTSSAYKPLFDHWPGMR